MDKISVLNWQGQDLQIRDRNSFPRKVNALVIGSDAILTGNYIHDQIESYGAVCSIVTDEDAGFSMIGTRTGLTFTGLLNAQDPDEKFTDILVLAGDRDYLNSGSIGTYLDAFISAAQTRYPEARIWFGLVGWSMDNTTYNQIMTVYNAMMNKVKAGIVGRLPVEAVAVWHDSTVPSTGVYVTVKSLTGQLIAKWIIYGDLEGFRIFETCLDDDTLLFTSSTNAWKCEVDPLSLKVTLYQRTSDVTFTTTGSPITFLCNGNSSISMKYLYGYGYGTAIEHNGNKLIGYAEAVLTNTGNSKVLICPVQVRMNAIKELQIRAYHSTSDAATSFTFHTLKLSKFTLTGDLLHL